MRAPACPQGDKDGTRRRESQNQADNEDPTRRPWVPVGAHGPSLMMAATLGTPPFNANSM
jgi:hypothetical protein